MNLHVTMFTTITTILLSLALGSAATAQISLVSDSRRLDIFGTAIPVAPAFPPSAFAPFDAELQGTIIFNLLPLTVEATQSSTVSTTGMSAVGFGGANGTYFCDPEFGFCFPNVLIEGYTKFEVEFDADQSAPYLFVSAGVVSIGELSLRDLTSGVSVGGLCCVASTKSGTLTAGHRYRMKAETNGFAAMNSFAGFGNYDFSLDFFDPSTALAFGPAIGSASLLGGASTAGGLDVVLGPSAGEGVLAAAYQTMTLAEIEGAYAILPFALPGGVGAANVWTIDGGELFQGTATLTFGYDPSWLPVGFDETTLSISHFNDQGQWELLSSLVDEEENTISVESDSFSPFALVSVPEPGVPLLALIGSLALGGLSTCRSTGPSRRRLPRRGEQGSER